MSVHALRRSSCSKSFSFRVIKPAIDTLNHRPVNTTEEALHAYLLAQKQKMRGSAVGYSSNR
eukprot:3586111-Pleurochrysis_carterae.AAC.1